MPGKTPFQKRFVDELRAVVIMTPGQGKRQGGPDALYGFRRPLVRAVQQGTLLRPPGIEAGSG
jgi:hypothetical protein